MKLDTTKLDSILKNLDKNLDEACGAVGFAVEGKAKTLAPIETGALRSSIYTRTKKEDRYGEIVSSVASARPNAETESLPEPSGNVRATVGAVVEYAEYVEFGGANRCAKPYMTPAVEDTSQKMGLPVTWEKLWE